MDKNKFFREAALRICGNLEIEKALQSCLLFMKGVMPVDIIFLEYYDADFGAMRTIAKTTATECSKLDLITPLSDEAKQTAALKDLPYYKDVYIYKDPQKYAISRELLQFHELIISDYGLLEGVLLDIT